MSRLQNLFSFRLTFKHLEKTFLKIYGYKMSDEYKMSLKSWYIMLEQIFSNKCTQLVREGLFSGCATRRKIIFSGTDDALII